MRRPHATREEIQRIEVSDDEVDTFRRELMRLVNLFERHRIPADFEWGATIMMYAARMATLLGVPNEQLRWMVEDSCRLFGEPPRPPPTSIPAFAPLKPKLSRLAGILVPATRNLPPTDVMGYLFNIGVGRLMYIGIPAEWVVRLAVATLEDAETFLHHAAASGFKA